MALMDEVISDVGSQKILRDLAGLTPFPRRVFLDQIIVREIPLEDLIQQGDISIPIDHAKVTMRNRQGVVVAYGNGFPLAGIWIDPLVRLGDVVHFEDTSMYSQVFINPTDEFKTGLPKFWLMRVQDLKGVSLA